jgi:hypothetical protein
MIANKTHTTLNERQLQLSQTSYKTHDIDKNRSNEPANFSGNINNKTIKSNSVENCKRKHVKGLINQDSTLHDDVSMIGFL